MRNSVTRWVVTIPSAFKGFRMLALPCQGINSFETKEKAEEWIRSYLKQGRYDVLGIDMIAQPWDCHPVHLDPISVYGRAPQ
jgi:hypothetical protein